MKIHEYQAKDLFKDAGIPVTEQAVAATAAEAVEGAKRLGLPVVIKAQVHVGGRGKAGGVKVVTDEAEVAPTAEKILNLTIKDLPVRKVLIAPAVDIQTEVYLSILIDRGARTVVFIGCAEGGVEIEETAKTAPEKILRHEVDARELRSLTTDAVNDFAKKLFSEPKHIDQAAELMVKMARIFVEKDCSLIEINPLVIDGAGNVVALDAKVLLDDNALFRHPELASLRDLDAEDKDELEAKEYGLSFIRLDGNIGCMVNGAGLAMATMDTIKHFGGNPANFLDVGGSSDPKKVVAAFDYILKDPNVNVILINIFGGITRCDDIARGILAAREQTEVPVPIVIRLIGTNDVEGRKLLEDTPLIPAETLEEGATKAANIGAGK
jgi:succinyl-CoA synthetase beta subunit